MGKRTIVTLPGDGIGRVVLEETLRVLTAAGFEANYVEGDIGWEFWIKEGEPLPQRTIDLIAKHKIALFGAITSKPKDAAFEELSPELKEKNLIYSSPIVGLRQHFNLDICLRPTKSYLGNPLNFVRRGANGEIEEPAVDLAIVSAVASSFLDKPLANGTVVLGEVGLTGEIRAISHAPIRIAETCKMGFGRCIVPESNIKRLSEKNSGIKLIGVKTVYDAVEALF